MIKRLLTTRPARRLGLRLVRGAALLVALALAVHALTHFLVSAHHGGSEWTKLGLTLVISLLLVVSAARANPPRRPS